MPAIAVAGPVPATGDVPPRAAEGGRVSASGGCHPMMTEIRNLEAELMRFRLRLGVVALVVLLGLRWNTALLFEAAFLVAMLGFVGTVGLARYLTRGDVVEK